MKYPKSLTAAQERLLVQIVDSFSQDPRILGIGASGSFASDTMDRFSDLDLVIAIEPSKYQEVFEERFTLVKSIEGNVAAFSGEHVGEPRLIISLYAPATIHVDFKFVSLEDAGVRVDDTKVVWERNDQLTKIYSDSHYEYPQPNIQWIEDRFWVWVHYGATKIARGEYFEATEFLSFLRTVVLSPLALKQRNLTPSGVRWIEKRLPDFAEKLKETVASPNEKSLVPALSKCISLYLELRENEQVIKNEPAQELALAYFRDELSQ